MKTDYGIHYTFLTSIFTGEPLSEKLAVICHEIRARTATIRGYTDLLGEYLSFSDNVSAELKDYYYDLKGIVDRLWVGVSPCSQPRPIHLGVSLGEFAAGILPVIDDLVLHVERVGPVAAEMAAVFPTSPPLSNILMEKAHDIWANIDVLTNPDLELPGHIKEWLDIRDEVQERVLRDDLTVFEILLLALTNPLFYIRMEAVKLLCQLKHPNSVQTIITALADENAHVRFVAVEALGELDDVRAIEPLKNCLNDKKGFVRERAARAIESLSG